MTVKGKVVNKLFKGGWKGLAYDLLLSFFEGMLVKKWRRKLWNQVKGPRILEVGVGTGLNIFYYPSGVSVTALDLSEEYLQRARLRAERMKKPVELVQGDVKAMPFKEASFDTVVSSFLFCQVDEPRAGLQEIYRVLKPGGRFLMLEHVNSRGKLGKMMNIISGPFYRLFGDHIARDTEVLARQVGLKKVSTTNLFLDIVRLIYVEKEKGQS